MTFLHFSCFQNAIPIENPFKIGCLAVVHVPNSFYQKQQLLRIIISSIKQPPQTPNYTWKPVYFNDPNRAAMAEGHREAILAATVSCHQRYIHQNWQKSMRPIFFVFCSYLLKKLSGDVLTPSDPSLDPPRVFFFASDLGKML